MNNRVVMAFFGDQESRAAVQRLAPAADVIAVAFDLGGGESLDVLRDVAIDAGATRCHALDVREEFARDALLPALRARVFAEPSEAFAAMAGEFVAEKLRQIAVMENATVWRPGAVVCGPKSVTPAPVAPQRLAISFSAGVPIAVNGIAMTLTELMDSVETITGESALTVLQREYALAVA
ncbi:MAG: argininosuccinate synthase [Acidobacteria bacterium]|nr:argininosuccinate synthase [Acidobacteriota bacterium]